MKLEAGQVAVVTGAASGIGRALVDAFAARGLAVVLADVEQGALDAAVEELATSGASALGARVDVRRPEDLENLAARVQAEFGRVDVLCNNAGVIVPRAPVWEQSYADWQWIVDVNLHGVANGLRAFVPAMVAAGRGHVVNTASMAGLTHDPRRRQRRLLGDQARRRRALGDPAAGARRRRRRTSGVTVLCPGPVPSRIHDAARNRPADLPSADSVQSLAPGAQSWLTLTRVPAEDVAGQVLAAVEEGREYVLTHADILPLARARAEHLLSELSIAIPGGTENR